MKRAQLEPATVITIWRYVDRHRRRSTEPAGPCQTVGLFLLLLLLGVTWFLAVGCVGVQKIPVDPALWSQKQTRIGVAMVVPPPAGAHRVGAEGLLDMAINSGMTSDLDKHLTELRPVAFAPIVDKFEGRLRQAGFSTKRIARPIDVSQLRENPNQDAGHFNRDISALAASQGVDAVLLIGLDRWGTLRRYYGFIPLGDPKALVQVSGRLIARDGTLRWQIAASEEEATLPVPGDWDQAPCFPNVTRAVEGAERRAAAFLEQSFFGSVQALSPPPPKLSSVVAPGAVPAAAVAPPASTAPPPPGAPAEVKQQTDPSDPP